MKFLPIILTGLACVAQPANADFNCATLHTDEQIRWEKQGFEDTFQCVARSPSNHVLFTVWFDQFPDTSFETGRKVEGVVGGKAISWSLIEGEYILRSARLSIPGNGQQPPFQLLVGVPKLECSLLRDVLQQLRFLRIPDQSELP